MTEIQVPEEFIEQNKNLCQPRPKTSPHTKSERKSRREEVFKLHFEYGYSARRIAKMMGVHRNTINSDLSFWYSKLKLEYDRETYDDWLNKQLYRMESQRARLRREIDLDISIQEKLQIEKIISDLDSKISSLIIKIKTSKMVVFDQAVEFINNWMEKHKHKDRYMLSSSLYRIPEKSKEKIFQLLKTK